MNSMRTLHAHMNVYMAEHIVQYDVCFYVRRYMGIWVRMVKKLVRFCSWPSFVFVQCSSHSTVLLLLLLFFLFIFLC